MPLQSFVLNVHLLLSRAVPGKLPEKSLYDAGGETQTVKIAVYITTSFASTVPKLQSTITLDPTVDLMHVSDECSLGKSQNKVVPKQRTGRRASPWRRHGLQFMLAS